MCGVVGGVFFGGVVPKNRDSVEMGSRECGDEGYEFWRQVSNQKKNYDGTRMATMATAARDDGDDTKTHHEGRKRERAKRKGGSAGDAMRGRGKEGAIRQREESEARRRRDERRPECWAVTGPRRVSLGSLAGVWLGARWLGRWTGSGWGLGLGGGHGWSGWGRRADWAKTWARRGGRTQRDWPERQTRTWDRGRGNLSHARAERIAGHRD